MPPPRLARNEENPSQSLHLGSIFAALQPAILLLYTPCGCRFHPLLRHLISTTRGGAISQALDIDGRGRGPASPNNSDRSESALPSRGCWGRCGWQLRRAATGKLLGRSNVSAVSSAVLARQVQTHQWMKRQPLMLMRMRMQMRMMQSMMTLPESAMR